MAFTDALAKTAIKALGETFEAEVKSVGEFINYLNKSRDLKPGAQNLFTVIQKEDDGGKLKSFIQDQLVRPTLDDVEQRVNIYTDKITKVVDQRIAYAVKTVDDRIAQAKKAAQTVFIVTVVINVAIIALSLWNISLMRRHFINRGR